MMLYPTLEAAGNKPVMLQYPTMDVPVYKPSVLQYPSKDRQGKPAKQGQPAMHYSPMHGSKLPMHYPTMDMTGSKPTLLQYPTNSPTLVSIKRGSLTPSNWSGAPLAVAPYTRGPAYWRPWWHFRQHFASRHGDRWSDSQRDVTTPGQLHHRHFFLLLGVLFALLTICIVIVTVVCVAKYSHQPDVQINVNLKAYLVMRMNQTFTSSLSYSSSDVYKQFTSSFCSQVVQSTQRSPDLSQSGAQCSVAELRSGSIIVLFALQLSVPDNSTSTTNSTLVRVLGNSLIYGNKNPVCVSFTSFADCLPAPATTAIVLQGGGVPTSTAAATTTTTTTTAAATTTTVKDTATTTPSTTTTTPSTTTTTLAPTTTTTKTASTTTLLATVSATTFTTAAQPFTTPTTTTSTFTVATKATTQPATSTLSQSTLTTKSATSTAFKAASTIASSTTTAHWSPTTSQHTTTAPQATSGAVNTGAPVTNTQVTGAPVTNTQVTSAAITIGIGSAITGVPVTDAAEMQTTAVTQLQTDTTPDTAYHPSDFGPCLSNPCQNGGVCLTNGVGYVCNCTYPCLCANLQAGFNCELDIRTSCGSYINVADPNDCTSYFQCDAFYKPITTAKRQCPQNQIFNPSTLNCDWSFQVTCTPTWA